MNNSIRHWIVYAYTFPNNKKYIGKTCRTLNKRQGNNFIRYKKCRLLWNAIQKYGIDSIKQEILFEKDTSSSEVCEIEKYFIELYKTNVNKYNNPSYGYNLTGGGDGLVGWKPTTERYQQLCKQLKEVTIKNIGSKRTEESKQKMREAKIGKKLNPLSEEHKRKISLANSKENMTEETRIRRSESKKKKIIATNKETNESEVFSSLEEASKRFNVRESSISRWCRKTRNPTVNFTFDYYSLHSTDND